ncbi:hydantoinase/oxoprolinase N-terminal domain-containing protein [Cochlodiniinecator piscidefendens]|uniref:hydantoinase/oxoprolinase N-terminal domain-containing protein n=1 Tax=Cochlodiniinecator piscidefendens TaxID=2715756 RepID=UPI00140B6715|nr:hydantoinase/oxoprolinase family protein [Cochlodiniinecator piscidefendens]
MALMLGIDTGGTYTDAVLLRDEKDVIAKAKSLTTRHNLAEGVGAAIAKVMDDSGAQPAEIALVSLSTTLATNALVEGQGGRVALIFIGFDEKDLMRQGLFESLKGDPVIQLSGGHNHSGTEAATFDLEGLRDWLSQHGNQISGFAVASAFATRNPAHELAAQALIKEMTGKPVSCSHHLSSKLNGPKRAMTGVLNARLIGMIDHLISATEGLLQTRGVDAPLMVVRGDGALISSDMARERPIETILSGPAASIVGASWLTGEPNALVSDIGGTTTDVALLRDGMPMIDPAGARVGEFRTMVEAVAMRTTGLGGDSEVHLVNEGLKGGIFLGPQRVIPISLTAQNWPDLVHDTLDRQLNSDANTETDGRFVVPVLRADMSVAGLSEREAGLLARIGEEAHALTGLLQNRMEAASLKRLVERGHVQFSALTPSDSSHVLKRMNVWDQKAADKAAELFARRRVNTGDRIASSAQQLAQMVIDQLTEQTALTLLESAFEEDTGFKGENTALARHELTQNGLVLHQGLVSVDVRLNVPVIGLGASAHSYYPAVGERLRAPMVLPEHAEIANALGAVVGQISIRETGVVTSPSKGAYRVHFPNENKDFPSESEALEALKSYLTETAVAAAKSAGAEDLRTSVEEEINRTGEDNADDFLDAEITVIASGRPRIAVG